jgi:hypothetical protein
MPPAAVVEEGNQGLRGPNGGAGAGNGANSDNYLSLEQAKELFQPTVRFIQPSNPNPSLITLAWVASNMETLSAT